MASSNPLDLEITIISAKHLKNVNWRYGPLKPYASIHLDDLAQSHPHTTRTDDCLSTRPVWNESFTLPLPYPPQDSTLTLDVFHLSSNNHPATKPLVGTAKFPLSELGDNSSEPVLVKLDLIRPSGRPQGKVLVKLGLREHPQMPDYQNRPAYHNYYYPAPPPPSYHGSDYREAPPSPYGYADRYGHYSTYYSPQPLYNRPAAAPVIYSAPTGPSAPPPTTSPFSLSSESVRGGKGAPSAPVDYSLPPATSARTGELVGSMGGLSLDEAGGYENERVSGHEASGPKADYRELKRWY